MTSKLTSTVILSLSLGLVAPCSANLIVANSAGSTLATAQDLTLANPTEITGSLDGQNQIDVSMFKLDIIAADFSAQTVDAGPHGIPDTVLALFDMNGVGVYLNDDITGSNTLSFLPSGSGIGPSTDGIYYLAISRSANYPLDGSSNEIFMPVLSTDVVGPSSSGAVAGFDGGAFDSPNFDLINYDIVITGTVPEPTMLPFAAGAVLIAGFLRRKRILH